MAVMVNIVPFGKDNKESLEYLELSSMFVGKRYDHTVSKNSLIIDGYFLWELCSVGINIPEIMKEEGLNFGSIIVSIGQESGLKQFSLEGFKEATDTENFAKTLVGHERIKYASILSLLGNAMFLGDKVLRPLEDSLREYIRKNK